MRWLIGGVSALVLVVVTILVLEPDFLVQPRTSSALRPEGKLRTLASAQCQFLERNGRYAASLAELSSESLIGPHLGAGRLSSYRYALIASSDAPEYCWLAVASPVPETQEDWLVHLAVNQSGVIRYSRDRPIPLRADCRIDPVFRPLGK